MFIEVSPILCDNAWLIQPPWIQAAEGAGGLMPFCSMTLADLLSNHLGWQDLEATLATAVIIPYMRWNDKFKPHRWEMGKNLKYAKMWIQETANAVSFLCMDKQKMKEWRAMFFLSNKAQLSEKEDSDTLK